MLLTGGASRRFGTAKAALQLRGERLADRAARVLTTVCDPVVEVGPGFTPLPAVCESPPGRGPLAAVAAGGAALAERGAGASFLVLATDLPFVEAPLLELLRDHRAPGAVVPRVDGIAQSLCARYPAEVTDRAHRLVAHGRYAMRALLDELAVTWIDEDGWGRIVSARAFADVDTPDDATRLGVETPG